MTIADFHTHSKYSRATSRECVPEHLDLWARRKGIGLIGTGDFTHPAWREELAEKLCPAEDGLYVLKEAHRIREETPSAPVPRFLVTGEISSIYKKNGKVRKVHNLILLPGLEAGERLARRLEAVGNLHSDGRPILGLDSHDLLEITLECCPGAIFIPAHIWTPHFSLFGAFSGFDTIEECFEDLTPHIHALETGLSSDPPMNWRLSALDRYTLVSNSDAHSPSKLGREANLLHIPLSYGAVAKALDGSGEGFAGTIEFFPEEGKYHYDGHRNCGQRMTPAQAEECAGVCPVCGGRLTTGVLHRVEQLADRQEGAPPPGARPFESIVPLPEIIAASTGYTPACARVRTRYEALLADLGPEFFILRDAPLEEIKRVAGPCVAEGVRRMRAGEIQVSPGYDGEFGKIKILDEKEIELLSGQLCFFGDSPEKRKTPPKPQKALRTKKAGKTEPAPEAPLNRRQEQAVSLEAPAVAVVAGPGTGKTRTLIAKAERLLESGVKPGQITAVTFTNRAAGEIRQRLNARFGVRRAKAVHIGTFHSLCMEILSQRGPVTVIDPFEARAVAGEVLEALSLKLSPKKLLEAISKEKCGLPQTDPPPPGAAALYRERLEEYGVLDFDDLLAETLSLFEQERSAKLRAPFTWLLVDEFQDIDDLQYRLIQAWSRDSREVFVIGDPDQSVYGFRGSAPDCFGRFAGDFSAETVRLVQNYRSTPEILGCALPVISRNPGGPRVLEPNRPKGPAVRLLTSADDFSEAVFVAKEINRMAGGIDMLDAQASPAGTRGFSDFAVLYRTHRQAEVLEKCLTIEGIPYIVAGRDKLLADQDVRATLSFFRWLLNPADSLSRRAFQALRPGWMALAEGYASRAAVETPRKLLESWRSDTGITGIFVERLLNMAVFQDDMASFLQNLTLGRDGDVARWGGRLYTPDAVRLMTFHAAKGLEFPVVFLCGLRQGLLPLEGPGRSSDLQEERRLFYVGITRAMDELILLTSQTPSPFLAELPRDAIRTGGTVELKRPAEIKQLSLF